MRHLGAAALMLGGWGLCATAPASAANTAQLRATLTPERLGHSTSLTLALRIGGQGALLPGPLRTVTFRYPREFGLANSDLGVETCDPLSLEAFGPSGCSPDSMIGRGSALGAVPFGPEVVKEAATVAIFRAPDRNGHIALVFDAEGRTPVDANIVLTAELLPAAHPYGGKITIQVPLVPGLPGGPDVSLLELSAVVGPEAPLRYTARAGRRIESYVPRGFLLPSRCPRHGFPFAATLTFADGSRTSAGARVPCPHTRRPLRRKRAPHAHG